MNTQWYCYRSNPKQEHLAANHLRNIEQVEVFLPRLRFRRYRSGRRNSGGLVWFVEAFFPGYLFVKLQSGYQPWTNGYCDLVRFGNQIPTLSEDTMKTLKSKFTQDEIITVDPNIQEGKKVKIVDGPFKDVEAVIHAYRPPRERVVVLLDFLGQQNKVCLPVSRIAVQEDSRLDANV